MTSIKLILEDGTEIKGKSFGFEKSTVGEVVFNTAMTGYPESLTDPSHHNQILVLTYPLIGNYGVPGSDIENNILRFFESDRIHVAGLIISDYSHYASHWNFGKSLSDWLKEHKIPGIYGVDTRSLTKVLREKGTMRGKIILNEDIVDFCDINQKNLVAEVSTKEKIIYGNGTYKIMVIDCGIKNNIIRHLLHKDTTLISVPWNYNFLNDEYDGLLVSNGPGDPKTCIETINHLKKAFTKRQPIFGICLGNQLMCLAAGGDTYKLKYGHRSHNQPVLHYGTNRCYITSQNHGYANNIDLLKKDWNPLFINLNDQTNEGIQHKNKPFFSTQFHPEASGGPTDTDFLFDKFIDLIKQQKENK